MGSGEDGDNFLTSLALEHLSSITTEIHECYSWIADAKRLP